MLRIDTFLLYFKELSFRSGLLIRMLDLSLMFFMKKVEYLLIYPFYSGLEAYFSVLRAGS